MLWEKEDYTKVEALLLQAYQCFEEGNFEEAERILDRAHALDYESAEVQSALRACGFWKQRVTGLAALGDHHYKGDYLHAQWRIYNRQYRAGFSHTLENGSSRIKLWVFARALAFHEEAMADESATGETLLQAGRCLKVLGRYEEGIRVLETALHQSGKPEAEILAELADGYALIGESRLARLMMREALYLDAGGVDLDEITSPLFRRLIERLEQEKSPEDPAFAHWLGVYGALWGVLDIKRELTPGEYGKLKQEIYTLKNESGHAVASSTGVFSSASLPALLNRYLRLIDYYQVTQGDRTLVDEALFHIKLLSPEIYKQYFE